MINKEIQKLTRNERFFYLKFARMPSEEEIEFIERIGWINFLEIHNSGISAFEAGKKASKALKDFSESLEKLQKKQAIQT